MNTYRWLLVIGAVLAVVTLLVVGCDRGARLNKYHEQNPYQMSSVR